MYFHPNVLNPYEVKLTQFRNTDNLKKSHFGSLRSAGSQWQHDDVALNSPPGKPGLVTAMKLLPFLPWHFSPFDTFPCDSHQPVYNIIKRLLLASSLCRKKFSQHPTLKCNPCHVPSHYVTFCSLPPLHAFGFRGFGVVCNFIFFFFFFSTITLSCVAIVKPHYKSNQYWTNFITGLVIKFNTNYNIVVHQKYCNRTVISC